MAIDTISPVADSQLDPGDSFSFRVDDTYTSITVEVETAGGWEYAYDSSLSGAQAGYTVAVTIPTAGRHLFTVTRTAGWNLSPFSIRVVENETGSDATTTTNYTLYSANDYPQTSDPYFLQSIGDSFLAHYDTPSSYAGKVGYYPRVTATADGLEFVDAQALIDARGDVFGPASALDNAIARYDTTTGKLLQSSLATIDDTGKLLLVSSLSLNNTDIEGLRKAQFQEGAGVSTPASGFVYLYAKTDGKLYIKDDTGTETDLTSGGGGGGVSDHGALTGLADDDHTQYVLATGAREQEYATFDIAPAGVPTTEGTVFWDATDHTLAFKPDFSTSTMQVGQENWVRVYNDSGAQIDNGSIVYISGAEGVEGRPTIALAQANSATTSRVLGAATADIANGAFGYVTQFGLVRDVDTSAITAGTGVYLSATAAGGFTATEPESPNISVFLGYVLVQNATTGVGFITTLGNTGTNPAGSADILTIPARKGSAGTITTGQAVYVSGYNVGQSVIEVELADADGAGTMPALGLASGSITNSANGTVIVSGIIPNVDTSSFSVGDALYISDTAGGLVNTKPTDGSLIQKVGLCVRSNVSTGAILVIGAGRSNDITNSVYLPEQADHLNTPAAGYGELWLRNDTRQVPMFTDDQGTDYELVKSDNPGGNVNNSLALWQNAGGNYYLGDISALTYNGGALKFDSANANIQLSERSSAPSPAAGDGAYWVRNDAPNTPMFTDDAGNDFALNKPTVYHTIMGKMGGPTTTQWYTSILGSSFDNDVDWDDAVGANSSSDPVTDYVDYVDGSIFTAPFAGDITNIRISVRPLVAQDWTFIAFRQQWSGAAGTFTEIDNTGNVSITSGWNDFDMTPASLTTLAKGDSIGLLWTISDTTPTASDLSARIYVTFEAS